MKISKKWWIITALLIIASCSPPTPDVRNEGMPEWCRVYFTPHDPVVERMVSLIDSAQKRVWAAFYSFTQEEVGRALLRAKGRGVDVRVIMDDASARSKFSQAHLIKDRIPIKNRLCPLRLHAQQVHGHRRLSDLDRILQSPVGPEAIEIITM